MFFLHIMSWLFRAMHHDENFYSDPDLFIPERFLDKDGYTPVNFADTRDLGHHSFGFGRR